MEYEGLSRDDLANVRALNRAWLRCRGDRDVAAGGLTARLLDRLAAAPFLLFSFREHDDDWWHRLLENGQQQDLLDISEPSSPELHAVQFAGLAFIWGLARRNPYAARIISGAPTSWCEHIASVTLMRVFDRAASRTLIEPRFETISMMHRGFAQIGALQSMLTTGQPAPYGRLKAAACRIPETARHVADKV